MTKIMLSCHIVKTVCVNLDWVPCVAPLLHNLLFSLYVGLFKIESNHNT